TTEAQRTQRRTKRREDQLNQKTSRGAHYYWIFLVLDYSSLSSLLCVLCASVVQILHFRSTSSVGAGSSGLGRNHFASGLTVSILRTFGGLSPSAGARTRTV